MSDLKYMYRGLSKEKLLEKLRECADGAPEGPQVPPPRARAAHRAAIAEALIYAH